MSGIKTEKSAAFLASLPPHVRAAMGLGDLKEMHNPELKQEIQALGVRETTVQQAIAKSVAAVAATESLIKYQGFPHTKEEAGLFDPTHELDESQNSALKLINTNQFTCLIGAAGTGKTSLVKRSVADFIYGSEHNEPHGVRALPESQGPSIAIVAFTGKATMVLRKSMPQFLWPAIKTIHGLLEYKPSGKENDGMFYPSRNRQNPLAHDVIYVDEASMLGLNLWHNLLDACLPTTKIVLIGDLNQLTPVADSSFFGYALSAALDDSHVWKVAQLEKVHRQKSEGGQRILDTAYAILNGKTPKFDNPQASEKDSTPWKLEDMVERDWSVLGIELPRDTREAHSKISAFMLKLAELDSKHHPKKLYDPDQDLILTVGNGYVADQVGRLVDQSPLNETLSRKVLRKDKRGICRIDAGRIVRLFAIGDMVMATANESPDTKNRITNGTRGRVVSITRNGSYTGNRNAFGFELEITDTAAKLVNGDELTQEQLSELDVGDFELTDSMMDEIQSISLEGKAKKDPASHVVEVLYETGETRIYDTKIGVESIQLAYYMTTHKAQGSQAHTVYIICHHAKNSRINVEWMYTGITRATDRLVIFYTGQGLTRARIAKQIKGATLADKIKKFADATKVQDKVVNLYPEDYYWES